MRISTQGQCRWGGFLLGAMLLSGGCGNGVELGPSQGGNAMPDTAATALTTAASTLTMHDVKKLGRPSDCPDEIGFIFKDLAPQPSDLVSLTRSADAVVLGRATGRQRVVPLVTPREGEPQWSGMPMTVTDVKVSAVLKGEVGDIVSVSQTGDRCTLGSEVLLVPGREYALFLRKDVTGAAGVFPAAFDAVFEIREGIAASVQAESTMGPITSKDLVQAVAAVR